MASSASELATLRALTFRISSTNTAQLPQHVPAIAASLANCRTLLSSPQSSNTKAASNTEASVSLHKYRTLLSTLLQDRTPQGRWAAVVLIKATVEAGGWETLQKALPWVRGLLGILTKPDPPSLKKLAIIALTRIFILTREFPTLVREITTPSLPTFVQSCLQMASGKLAGDLTLIILECFNELLPRHPTIFRSYLKQFHPLLARLVSPTPSSKLGNEQIVGGKAGVASSITVAAQRLYTQLPCCAVKGASSEEWQKTLKEVISTTHHTADKIFRAVHEEWHSSTREALSSTSTSLEDDVQDLEPSSLGLPAWSGIFGGGERIVGLLHLIQQYLDTPTSHPVYLNVAAVIDLLSRILSLTVPGAGGRASQASLRFNNQVSKEERDSLWSILPDIHVATIAILLSTAARTQSSTIGTDPLLLDQLTWVFSSENSLIQVRTACYGAITSLLQRSGAALPKSATDSLGPLMRACCEDLLPTENSPSKDTTQAKINGNSKAQTTANADSFLSSSKPSCHDKASSAGLHHAAHKLLPVFLGSIKAQYLSDSMRSRLDRTAVLTQHKDAMIMSVLNPPPSKKFGKPAASMLPLTARSFASEPEVEALLRPRMPVIRLGTQDAETADAEEEQEEEEASEEDVEDVDQEMDDDDAEEVHAGHELDAALEAAGGTLASPEDARDSQAVARSIGPVTTETRDDVGVTPTTDPVPTNTMSKDATKRPHADEVLASPSKRVKSMKLEQITAHPVPSVNAVSTRVTRSSGTVPATSEFTVTSTASGVPELPTPTDAVEGANDSDEDDMISLVLGQDTDDESD